MKEGAWYPHGYDPRQHCDNLFVSLLCMGAIMSNVLNEMRHSPWRYTEKLNPHTDIKMNELLISKHTWALNYWCPGSLTLSGTRSSKLTAVKKELHTSIHTVGLTISAREFLPPLGVDYRHLHLLGRLFSGIRSYKTLTTFKAKKVLG